MLCRGFFGIIKIFVLAAVVQLSMLDGVTSVGVTCNVCDNKPLNHHACNIPQFCAWRCLYMVSGHPKEQTWNCIGVINWPAVSFNNRWATQQELGIMRQQGYTPGHTVWKAYICDTDMCKNQVTNDFDPDYDKKSSAGSSLQQQNLGFRQFLIFTTPLLLLFLRGSAPSLYALE